MGELKRIYPIRIANYYNSYLEMYENIRKKNREKASLSWEEIRELPVKNGGLSQHGEYALHWAIGIHRLILGSEQLYEAEKDYRKFIAYLSISEPTQKK